MNLPKALFLDLDDTIVAYSDARDTCWLTVSQKHIHRFPGVTAEELYTALLRRRDWYWSDPIRHKVGRSDMKAARRAIVAHTFEDRGIDSPELALLLADEYTAAHHQGIQPFPAAIETLEKLSRHVPLALLTNGDARFQRDKIARFGLERYFQCIVIESEFGAGKPDESVFRHALGRLNHDPADVWMVGDNLAFDIAPAQTLGMQGVWVDHRRQGLPTTSGCTPHRTVQSIAELLD